MLIQKKKKVLLGTLGGRKTQPINFLFWLLLFDSCCQPLLLLLQDWELGEMVSEERELCFKLLLRGKLGLFLNQKFSDLVGREFSRPHKKSFKLKWNCLVLK